MALAVARVASTANRIGQARAGLEDSGAKSAVDLKEKGVGVLIFEGLGKDAASEH